MVSEVVRQPAAAVDRCRQRQAAVTERHREHRTIDLAFLVQRVDIPAQAVGQPGIESERCRVAPDRRVDIGVAAFAHRVDTQAEAVAAETAADIGGQLVLRLGTVAGGQRGNRRLAGTLGRVTGNATGLGEAVHEAGQPLEQLDPLEVLERQVGVPHRDVQAVDLETVQHVDLQAANRDHRVFARNVVARFSHRGIGLEGIGDAGRLLVGDILFGRDADRERRVEQRLAAERAGAGQIAFALGGDGDGR